MQKPLQAKIIKYFKEIDSTNRYAEDLVNNNRIDDGSVVLTDFQTQGRGVEQNIWESENKKNLLLSIILYPVFLAPEKQFALNKVISLAVCETVKEFVNQNHVTIKWPNDIYVGRKKIAGILSKNMISGNYIQSSIIGVGLNVNQMVFGADIPNPVSLKMITGKSFTRTKVLKKLLERFNHFYNLLVERKTKIIDKKYLAKLMNYNSEALYRSGDSVFAAKITGVSKFGQLQMDSGGKNLQFEMKEIEFL